MREVVRTILLMNNKQEESFMLFFLFSFIRFIYLSNLYVGTAIVVLKNAFSYIFILFLINTNYNQFINFV